MCVRESVCVCSIQERGRESEYRVSIKKDVGEAGRVKEREREGERDRRGVS